MPNPHRTRRVAALAAAAAIGLTGCSIATAPDEVGLEYDAGPVSATKFDKCVPPSTREYRGPGDQGYKYPAGQRTFDFTGVDGAERGPISVTDKDGVTLQVPGVATFSLNDECGTLRRFHEEIGRKYSAYDDEGWLRMLSAYFGNPLEKAMDQASQRYTWRQMLQDEKVRIEWQNEVGALARQYLKDQAGADFFCSPLYAGKDDCGEFALTIQKPVLPESIQQALAETAAEVERKNQAENAQARIDVEAESLRRLVDVLGADGAVLYEAIKEGKVTVVPVPQGTALQVNPGPPQQ